VRKFLRNIFVEIAEARRQYNAFIKFCQNFPEFYYTHHDRAAPIPFSQICLRYEQRPAHAYIEHVLHELRVPFLIFGSDAKDNLPVPEKWIGLLGRIDMSHVLAGNPPILGHFLAEEFVLLDGSRGVAVAAATRGIDLTT
jgi:hypothetical protein